MELGKLSIPADGREWQPVKTWQLITWLVIYAALMLTYREMGARILDAAYLVVHEAGHPLFSYLGVEILTVLGGTIMQLLVPILLLLGLPCDRLAAALALVDVLAKRSHHGIAVIRR